MDSMQLFLSLCFLLVSIMWLNFTYFQILSVLVIIQVVRYLVTTGKGNYSYPAGPKGLPVIGSLPWIIYQGTDKFMLTMARKYGAMMTVRLGQLVNVIINDYDVMKEFSLDPQFQDRVNKGIVHEFSRGNGVINNEGSSWKHQRRFVLHALRDSGMGTMQMEEKIHHETRNVIEEMKRTQGQVISIDMLMEKSTCNVIFGLAFNKTYDYNDPQFIDMLSKLDEIFRGLSTKVNLISLFPWLMPLIRKDHQMIITHFNALLDVAADFIKEHREDLDENNARDLLDLYLMEINKPHDENVSSEYHSAFTEEQLVCVIMDLFVAGTETSSTTIRWALLYMILNPDIQKKVQQEIDDVVGRERSPTNSDRINLPYTVATLQEVERMASIVPLAVPRSNAKPATFKQCAFPARCMFSLNILAVHRDPKLWREPEKFMPSRFINDEGKVFRPPYLVPFGSGKRSCAGEALAKMEIFLMFAMLMQTFTFESEPGKLLNDVPVVRAVRAPAPFKIRVHDRSM